MFFILSKILAFLTTPGFWIFCLLLAAWIKARKRKQFLLAAIITFFVFSNGFILNAALHWWEWDKTPLPNQVSTAVILGGYSSYNKELNQVEFSGSADRILIPFQLYQKGSIDQLILSGGSGELLEQTFSQQEKVAAFLYESGVPNGDIIIEPKSRNTRENAEFTSSLIDSLGLRHTELILVTSAIHMRRSLKCFEKEGIDIYPYPVDFNSESISEKATFRYIFIPDMAALEGWNHLLHEWIGYIMYWMMGYI